MNPVLLTIPVFIAATLTLACGMLFAIIHQKDERIADLLEDKEISLKAITTMRKLYEVEVEVSKKLEDDLLEADKEFDAKDRELKAAKETIQHLTARTFTGRKRNNKGQFVTVAKDVEP
jgi:hypothetical protein